MSEVKKSFDITTDFGSQEMSEVYNYGKRKSRKRTIHSYYIAYHIGKHRIYEYNNTKVGKYKTLSQAAEKLIQIFKQEKIKELDNSLNWVKMQLKRKVIDTDLEELISQVKEIKSRLATDDKLSQSAFDEIVNTINKNRTLTKNTSFTSIRDVTLDLIPPIYGKYKIKLDSLYAESNEKYKFRDNTKIYLNGLNSYLSKNKKYISEILKKDPKLVPELKKLIKEYSNYLPDVGILASKNEELEIIKSTFELIDKEVTLRKKEEERKRKKEEERKRKKEEEKRILKDLTESFKVKRSKYEEFKDKIAPIDNQLVTDYGSVLNTYESYLKQDNIPYIKKLESKFNKEFDKFNHYIEKVSHLENTISHFLKSNIVDNFLIINGRAGTGKTTLIQAILNEHFKKDLNLFSSLLPEKARMKINEFINNKEVILSAPTRVACANIRQRRIFHARTLQSVKNKREEEIKSDLINSFENLKLLIIDESSMVNKQLLIEIHNYFGEDIRNGKLKIIFIGDHGQLTPANEGPSVTLSEPYLEKLFGKGMQLELDIDYRLKDHFSDEYINFLEILRDPDTKDKNALEIMNKHLAETGDIKLVEEKNEVIRFFNSRVHLGYYAKTQLDNNENFEDIIYSLNKISEFKKKKFTPKETEEALRIYKGEENRRPELAKLYSQYYPSVEERIKNTKELQTIMSLFRTNDQVVSVNHAIRPYLFKPLTLKENDVVCKGEVLRVETTQHDEDDFDDTNLYRGDSFVVVSEPIDLVEGFKEVTVKQLVKSYKSPFRYFFNLGFNKKNIVIWTGGLEDNISKEVDKDGVPKEGYGSFVGDKELDLRHKKAIESLVELTGNSEKIEQSYRVSYDYAKVTYAAQGGEWDKVIVQAGDTWENHKDSKRYLYTALTRGREEILLYT